MATVQNEGSSSGAQPADESLLAKLRAVNDTSAFNRWAGMTVAAAAPGEVTLELGWREEFAQYAGFMHAGLVGALIDTAGGFAAATLAGQVLASQYQVAFYSPVTGLQFRVIGRVVKAGRRQIFANAELFSVAALHQPRLLAGGSIVLMKNS